MRKHSRRLSLHKETLADLQPVHGGLEVGLAPTFLPDCRQSIQGCLATRAACLPSLRFTDCPAACTDEITNYCRP